MGGNVFGNTKPIKKEDINPTLDIYFDCLCLAFPDKTLFNEIYSNFRKDYYDKNDFKDTMILYFSKRKSFNVKDFENFWNYYIKHLDFNLVKKNSIILYNTDSDIKIFQDSLLIIEKQ